MPEIIDIMTNIFIIIGLFVAMAWTLATIPLIIWLLNKL